MEQHLLTPHKCINCGKEFLAYKRHFRRFCGRKCANNYNDTKFQNGHQQSNTGRTHFKKNQKAWNKGIPYIQIQKEKHWKYKDGMGCYRRYNLKALCEKCGFKQRLIVHHKDKNRHNNNSKNLQTLCRSCHGFEHSHKGMRYAKKKT